MTNTYMLGGDNPAEEIVAGIKRGLYATNFGGGQGRHHERQVRVLGQRGLLGRERQGIQYPVKGATIIGNGPGRADAREHDRQRHGAWTPAWASAARTARACRWAWASRRCASTG